MPISTIDTASISGLGYGFKNRIINGGMVIDQRNAGASFTSSGLFYCLDRWMLQAVGATNTAQQVTGSTGNNKAVRITGNTSNTLTGFSQRIESWNILDCASQSVTVSFTLSGSASGSVSVRRIYPTATDNYTSTTEPDSGVTVNFTTTATRYTATFTLSSNANKGLWLYFDFGAVGSGVTRTLEDVQLEKGTVATSFDVRPYGTELALCQRYYYVMAGFYIEGYANGGSVRAVTIPVNFPVTMRATPTRTVITAGSYNNVRGSSSAYAGLGLVGLSATFASASAESAGAGLVQCSNQTESMSAEL
jgi:hypothetical protein